MGEEEWISVDDRVPEEDEGFVLLCIKKPFLRKPDINIGYYRHVQRGGWRTRWGPVDDGKVTHWRRLPEPPGEEEGSDE